MNRKLDRGQTTRQVIVDTATRLFAEIGYDHVSIETVLTACGVSRGALYHHFTSKEVLFEAALEAAEAEVAKAVAAAAQGEADPLDALRAGCGAWLRLAADDAAVRQIVLTDAPSVVGWRRWREIDERNSLGLLRGALTMAANAGRLNAARVDIYAHTLLAVLVEIALLVATSKDAPSTIQEGEDVLSRVLNSFCEPSSPVGP